MTKSILFKKARMLTYDLKSSDLSLYDALYRAIREDILSGRIKAGEKLPSKRALAEHLRISKSTVENAYAQLVAEGYVLSRCRSGYFAERMDCCKKRETVAFPPPPEKKALTDLSLGAPPSRLFPFSVWTRLMRGVMAEGGEALLRPTDSAGVYELRSAIARYLYRMRGLRVLPEQIVVGAGTEYLYQLILQLLGQDRIYATEEPGHKKFRLVAEASGVRCTPIPMDGEGLCPRLLEQSGAGAVHLSPTHHFPTGTATSPARRRALLKWAQAKDRYLIEDDYDSEFRLSGRPIPPLFSTDTGGRVIYLNTFSKTMAPSFRIGYMVLPPALLEAYQSRLGFYASTVPAFEQYTLARFLDEGYFEKHLARMKKHYKTERSRLLSLLADAPFAEKLHLSGTDAGLHFSVSLTTERTDEEIRGIFEEEGFRVCLLSDYYKDKERVERHVLILSDAGLSPEILYQALLSASERL
jgi:GntR family transcriptional regulator/MocR family aminotransferase